MWFVYALIALLFWSGSDLFSKIGSRPDDKYSHWKMVMAVGTVMGIHAFIEMAMGTKVTLYVLWRYLPASLLYIVSMIFGYVGLRYIELSISSPICNSSGALVSLMCFFILGDTLEALQWTGVALVCVGVIGLGIIDQREDAAARLKRRESLPYKYEKSILALLLPLLYCVLDALGTFVDGILLEELDEVAANCAYELTFFLMAIFAFIYVVIIKKEKLTIPRERPKLIGALCETAGQFAYVYAIDANTIAAAPVISAYCMASVIWSRIFLKEKLSWKHYVVIAITIVGIVLLGMFDA